MDVHADVPLSKTWKLTIALVLGALSMFVLWVLLTRSRFPGAAIGDTVQQVFQTCGAPIEDSRESGGVSYGEASRLGCD